MKVVDQDDLVEINEPPKSWTLPRLRDVWRHRELVYFLGRRDVAVRYKQTIMGVLWVVLQPLLLALIFSVFLGLLARHVPSEGVPYPVFALAGMTMWLFLATALSKCSESTISNAPLISKVYFPRLVIPFSALLQPAVDFAAAVVVLVVVMLAYGAVPSIRILLLAPMLLLATGTALGLGLWFAALVVRYRDVRQVIPFLIQALIFVTPVVYPLSVIPSHYRVIYSLNPFVAVLEGFRWVVLPHAPSPGLLFLLPLATSIVFVVGGLLYFAKAEAAFADVI